MKTQHEILMEDPEFRRLLTIEALVTEASEMIARLMAERNVSRADLARKLNKSRLGNPVAERQSRRDHSYTGRGCVCSRGGGETERPTAGLEA